MKILAHVHGYPPVHLAGAEWALHGLLTALQGRGHECRVVCQAASLAETGVFDGIPVIAGPTDEELRDAWDWCDTAITHLDMTAEAVGFADRHDRPLVHYAHNHHQLASFNVPVHGAQLVIACADWVAGELPHPWPAVTVYPPIDHDHFREIGNAKGAVTLVNLNENKGGNVLAQLAASDTAGREWLGVRGGYGDQIAQPDGVTVTGPTPDMVSVYVQARVVLMPSAYESWGRVAVEAMTAGIPVIAHPTPGLRESLGDAGIFCDRSSASEWHDALARLDDPAEYAAARDRALARAAEIEAVTATQLDAAASAIESMVARWGELPALTAAQRTVVRRGTWVRSPEGALCLVPRDTWATDLGPRGWREVKDA